jgi:hypothetical protein
MVRKKLEIVCVQRGIAHANTEVFYCSGSLTDSTFSEVNDDTRLIEK